MMTYKEVATLLSVPLGTVYAWVARQCIPHIRLADRSVRFEKDAIEAWLAERRKTPSTTKVGTEVTP